LANRCRPPLNLFLCRQSGPHCLNTPSASTLRYKSKALGGI
jgi:hypothetical protein